MDTLMKNAPGATTPSTNEITNVINTKETSMSTLPEFKWSGNTQITRKLVLNRITGAYVTEETVVKHGESYKDYAKDYEAFRLKHDAIIERIRRTDLPYENNIPAAPKSMGINDTNWVLGHKRPYATKRDGVETWHTPIHGWADQAGWTFDDSEDVKEQKIAESRGYTTSIDPHLVIDGNYYAASDLQYKALHSLHTICQERGINITSFSEGQIRRYVRDFIAKHTDIEVVKPNLSRFA